MSTEQTAATHPGQRFSGTKRETALRAVCQKIAMHEHEPADFDRMARAGDAEPRALETAINSLDTQTLHALIGTTKKAAAAELSRFVRTNDDTAMGEEPAARTANACKTLTALHKHTYENVGFMHTREGTEVVASHKGDIVELERTGKGRKILADAVERYGLGASVQERTALVEREYEKQQRAMLGIKTEAPGLKPIAIDSEGMSNRNERARDNASGAAPTDRGHVTASAGEIEKERETGNAGHSAVTDRGHVTASADQIERERVTRNAGRAALTARGDVSASKPQVATRGEKAKLRAAGPRTGDTETLRRTGSEATRTAIPPAGHGL